MGEIFDASGAARILNISHAAVSKHIKRGNIKTVFVKHLGKAGKVMIRERSLKTFIYGDVYRGDVAAALRRLEEVG